MKLKKIIKLLLIIIWMSVIFNFSAQDSTKSENTSNKVIISTAEVIKNKPLTKIEKETIISKYKVLVRKAAHFFLYFILAILVYVCLKDYLKNDIKIVLLTIIICALYACSDELHQLFSIGRTARVFDIFVDTCGATLSTLVLFVIINLKKKKIKKV